MALIVDSFDPKRVDEDWVVTFDFVQRLGPNETISTATYTATTFSGTDASPGDIISGSATVTGSKVTQLIINGLDGVTYQLQCEITTSNSQRLDGIGLLSVTNTIRRR